MNQHTAHPDDNGRSSEDLTPSDRQDTEAPAGDRAESAPAGATPASSGSAVGQAQVPPRLYQAGDPEGPYAVPPNYGAAPHPDGPEQGGASQGGPRQDSPQPAGQLPGRQPQNFFSWIRSQGIHRGRDRWIGGVASGIAERLGVDPLIIRGILIVLTVFAGVGVLAYGLAWALLPEPDGRIHVQEAAAGRWTGGMTGALITTVIGFPSLGTGVWGWDRYGLGAFIWTVFWVGGAIYLIYYLTQRNKTRTGTAPMPLGRDSTSPAGAAAFAVTAGSGQQSPTGFPQDSAPAHSQPADGGGYGAGSGGGPAWGPPPPSGPTPPGPVPPGGYGPWSGSTPPPPAAPRNLGPGTPAVAITVGSALLAGGGIKALDAANVIELGDAGNALAWAVAAAVLGLGILLAGLRGRTSGILGFFAVVALLIGGVFSAVPNSDRFRFQNADWTPASVEQARSGFEITGGTGTADLTRLALNAPLGSDVVIPIDATASNLTVVIPDTVPVQVRADITMGNLHEGSQVHGGMTQQQSEYNTAKPGARLVLEISGTISNVTIKEGK